jgi:hypothetical protein
MKRSAVEDSASSMTRSAVSRIIIYARKIIEGKRAPGWGKQGKPEPR